MNRNRVLTRKGYNTLVKRKKKKKEGSIQKRKGSKSKTREVMLRGYRRSRINKVPPRLLGKGLGRYPLSDRAGGGFEPKWSKENGRIASTDQEFMRRSVRFNLSG